MAVEIASAYVSIIPTTKGIAGNLEKELVGPMKDAAKKAGDEAGATMKKSLADTGKSFTKFGIGALAVAAGIGAGLLATGKSASDLGESINAVKVTFGSAAAGILKLGEDAAQSVGLSNSAFNGLAVQFSSFATTIAGKGGDVVGTIDDMTVRAADFASVMNIEVAEAARLFQSGLAGETEPLKKYGLDLSAAAVNAYAAANGIGQFGMDLTEAEKVTARYGLLIQSTDTYTGDFAATADGAANSTRIAKAELENASAQLGAAFTPAIAFAAGAVGDMAQKFAGLNEATGGWLAKGAGIAALALGAAGGISLIVGQAIKLHDSFVKLGSGLTSLKAKLISTEGGLTKLGTAVSIVGAVAVAATLIYQTYADKKEAITAITNDFVTALEAEAAGQTGAIEATIAARLASKDFADEAERLGVKVKDMSDFIHGANVPSLEFTRVTTQNSQASIVFFTQLRNLRDGLADAGQQIDRTADANKELGVAQEDAGVTTEGLANATKFVESVIKAAADATEDATRKANAFADALVRQREKTEDLYGKEFDAIQSKHDLADATTRAEGDVAVMNETLKKHKEGTAEATAATDAAYDSIVSVAEQYGTLNGAALGSDSSIRRQIDSLTLQAGQLAPGSPLRQALEQYIAELAAIPSNVATQLELNISIGQVATAAGDLIGIRSKGPGDSNAHARGGPASGRILVGEEGPEFLDVPQGSFVHTAQATRAMQSASQSLTASGGITVNNYRRDIGVGDLNQILAMARLAA